jgi:hypothetical protein
MTTSGPGATRLHGPGRKPDSSGRQVRHLVKIATLPRPCLAILAGSRNHTIPADHRPIWVLAVMTHDRSRANLEVGLDQLISRRCRDPGWVQATWLSQHESSLDPAEPGMEGSVMPSLRAIRQPRLRWIVTADHVIPPAAPLAMAQHARAHIVKVDASQLSMISHPQR